MAVRDSGFVGKWFGNAGEKVYGGSRVEDVVARARDTGTTVNKDDDTERFEQLERLARLREGGALTDEEFEAEKRRVLGGG
jgi:hypothetical protein